MMTTDVEGAINALSEAVYDLTLAFAGLGGALLTRVAMDGQLSAEELADVLDKLASTAGDAKVEMRGGISEPNAHLAMLANNLRAQARNEPVHPFSVIDGGKAD